MKRRTMAILGVVVVVAASGGVYVAHRLATGGEVTEVGAAEALARYRQQAATTTSAPSELAVSTTRVDEVTTTTANATTTSVVSSLVASGVYQYATTGFDQVDVLTGARHDYPSVTTITVVPRGCGVRLRWDVAVERWDSWDWCLEGDAVRQTGWLGYHEFFGTAGQNDYTCDGDPRPLDAPARTTWTMTCSVAGRTSSQFTGTVIGRTTLTIAGSEIPVLHARYDVDVTGESTGCQSIDGWYRTTDGLPVRERLSTSTKQDTVVGVTNFEENYTIELLTPTPAT